MPPKRKTEDGDSSTRPKKMSKEEKAAAKARAREAMMAEQQQQPQPAKATTAAGAAPPLPPPKNKKEERAQARERARLAMQNDSSAQTPSKTPPARRSSPRTTTTAAASSAKKKAPAKKPAPKVTIKEEQKQPAKKQEKDDDNAFAMPLPPTSLQRTQSTPLELELEHQVAANVKAALAGQPPPFTEAPPDHLLKFAPTELEEGYDHNEQNAKDIEDEEEDAETQDTPKQGDFAAADMVADAVTSAVIHTPAANPVVPGSIATLLWALILGLVFKWVVYNHMSTYHYWFHVGMATLVPVSGNPYRTADGSRPLPYMPCFATNVDDPPVPYRDECNPASIGSGTVHFTPCPPLAQCWGGHVQQCLQGSYLQVSPNGKSCAMKPAVARVYQHVVDTIAGWALDYHCQNELGDEYFSMVGKTDSDDDSPSPHMVVALRDEPVYTRKQPMFHVDYVLDVDPFLLRDVTGNKATSLPPLEALWQLLEAGNPVRGYPLKLKIFESYNHRRDGSDSDGTEMQVAYSHLVAVVPSKQYVNKLFPLRTQCRYRQVARQYTAMARTPWLVALWCLCMALLLGWIALTIYYHKRAKEQQHVLQQIEVVREYTLQTLQSSAPQTWKGMELKLHLLQNGVVAMDDDKLFQQRIWPRVVFDIRGNPNVYKSVMVANGDLVDVWKWEPRELATAATASS